MKETALSLYPQFFNECFDFSPPNGWNNLLIDLFRELSDLNIHIDVFQVKQKYGKLVIYYELECITVDLIINKYKELASNTCEFCSASPATIHNKSGYICICCKLCT